MNHSFHVLETVSIGVDWITATVRPGKKSEVLAAMVERWFTNQEHEGNYGKAWKWNGYSGSVTDGVSYGWRDDGFLVRLSGSVALNHWREVARYCDNVSRLDVQVTGLDDSRSADWATLAKASAMFEARIAAGLTQTQLITSTPSGSTFTVGSRSSDRYLRVYNKTAESGGVWPDTCWRWEVEYKAVLANSVCMHLLGKENADNLILSRVWHDFKSWLITVPCPSVGPNWRPMIPICETTDQSRLHWLRRCIRPMIDKMSQAYDVETLSEALGFHWVTDELTGVGAVYMLHGDTIAIEETGSEPSSES